MLLYIFLVTVLVILIIWIAILVVRKRRPEYKPTPVKSEPDLNNLDALVGTVKKKKTQPVKTNVKTEQPRQEQKDDVKEYTSGSMIDEERFEKSTKQNDRSNRFAGRRGKPPKRPPRPNLREAMKASEILGKPKAQS